MLVKKITVEIERCNADGKLKLSGLQRYLQDCAGEDFDTYGTTGDEMRKNGMAFVLTRISMDIIQDMYAGDNIEILTVHDHIEGVCMIREYVVVSQRGFCCRATTVWIILNLNTRRILRPTAIEHYPPSVYMFKQQVDAEKRIFSKEEITSPAGEILITKDYIDENGHVNNTYYQDFVAKAVDGRYCGKKITHVQISYVHEAFEGALLNLSGIFEENIARVRAENGDSCCFEAIVKFTEKENGK